MEARRVTSRPRDSGLLRQGAEDCPAAVRARFKKDARRRRNQISPAAMTDSAAPIRRLATRDAFARASRWAQPIDNKAKSAIRINFLWNLVEPKQIITWFY
jgi:hypothetical protein